MSESPLKAPFPTSAKIRWSLVVVDVPKEVPMTGRDVVRNRMAHERRTMTLRVDVGPLVDVGRVYFIDSRVERLLGGRELYGMAICCSVGTGSFGLGLCHLVYFLLLGLGLLELKNLLSDQIHRILLLELVLFYALQGSLKGSKFSLGYLELQTRKQVQHHKAVRKISNATNI